MKTRDKRHLIMQAAERLFTHRRIHEITLDEVARHARVGKGTIYLHFKDKDDLFFQVATSGFDELCELLRQKVSADAPFANQLLEVCVAISAFFDRRREMFHMMQAEDARMPGCKESLRERWLNHRKKLVAAVAAVLGRGVADGLVRKDIPPDVLASFLLGMLRTRAHDLQDAPAPLQRYELLIDIFLNGVARAPGRTQHVRPAATDRRVRPFAKTTSRRSL